MKARTRGLRRYLRNDRWRSIIVGVAAFLAVIIIGGAALVGGGRTWTATTTLVLLPGKTIDSNDAAGYFDTLSSGQITQTAGQILGLSRFKAAAANEIHLPPSAAVSAHVSANVVTGSSIVTLAVSAPSASVAERMANAVVDQATQTVNTLIDPYQISVVSSAVGTASAASRLGSSKLLVILLLVGVALGLGLQQATYQLSPAIRRARSRGGLEEPPPLEPAVGPVQRQAPHAPRSQSQAPANRLHAEPSSPVRRTKVAHPSGVPASGLVSPPAVRSSRDDRTPRGGPVAAGRRHP